MKNCGIRDGEILTRIPFLIFLFLLVSGCIDANTPAVANFSDGNDNNITIASFNLQVFGQTKANKPEVMDVLAKIIRRYDIVAVQEIRDSSQTALPRLMTVVNTPNNTYSVVVSERLGRTASKEQYAYIYNTQKVRLRGAPYTYPDSNDMFHREPYIARFVIVYAGSVIKNSSFDFVLVNIHTDPDTATQEIIDLPKVLEGTENNYIILGDLNADCEYFDETGYSPHREVNYFWVINDSVDTTTKSTNCTYDRIILTNQTMLGYVQDAGVFRYDIEYKLNYTSTIAVSDHYPVYAKFQSK